MGCFSLSIFLSDLALLNHLPAETKRERERERILKPFEGEVSVICVTARTTTVFAFMIVLPFTVP